MNDEGYFGFGLVMGIGFGLVIGLLAFGSLFEIGEQRRMMSEAIKHGHAYYATDPATYKPVFQWGHK